MTMCDRDDILRRPATADVIPPTHAGRDWANDRALICSNAPERIPQLKEATAFELWEALNWSADPPTFGKSNPTHTLYKCLVAVPVGIKRFRVFLWHINRTAAQTLHFTLLAGLSGPLPGGGSQCGTSCGTRLTLA
jgi:hypothetical protein